MAKSLNEVTLVGNVGADPEVRSTTGGNRVATITLATSRQWQDRSGTPQEKTQWHRLVLWNAERGQKLADLAEKYIRKGDKLLAKGEIEYRQWQDKEGQTRYTTEITVKEIILLSPKRDAEGNASPRAGAQQGAGQGAGQGAQRQAARPAAAAKGASGDDFEDFPGVLEDEDDDLPF